MNIKELNAGLRTFGKANTVLFGETIMIYGHTVAISENGRVLVDYNSIGRVTDDPFDLIDTIVKVTA